MLNLNSDFIPGLLAQDTFRGTNIRSTLKLLKTSQSWDEQKLRDYQSGKLRNLVHYAYHNVPYYENLFNSIRLKPSDVRSINDIGKIPILTKNDFRENNHLLISRTHSLRKIKKGKTGGTTGAPVFLYKDVNTRSFTWASYYRWYEWMGLNYSNRTATFWGARTVLKKNFKRKVIDKFAGFFGNEIRINSFDLNEPGLNSAYNKLCKFQPVLIKGYLSALLDFASFIKSNELYPLDIRAISSTTETLLPIHRSFLESVFKAPVYDQYGCGEVSAIAYECSKHEGLHVTLEHVICEILNEKNEQVYNQKGRLIATDLDNYVMPVLRFETGDMSSMSNEQCRCGMVHPLLQGIDGRTTNTLVLKSGAKVHGVFVTDILAEINLYTDKIRQFQIIQNPNGSIIFNYRVGVVKPDSADLKRLDESLSKYFLSVSITDDRDFLYSESGKFLYVINSID